VGRLQFGEQIDDRRLTETSSAETGSSATMTSGSPASARAIATAASRRPTAAALAPRQLRRELHISSRRATPAPGSAGAPSRSRRSARPIA